MNCYLLLPLFDVIHQDVEEPTADDDGVSVADQQKLAREQQVEEAEFRSSEAATYKRLSVHILMLCSTCYLWRG